LPFIKRKSKEKENGMYSLLPENGPRSSQTGFPTIARRFLFQKLIEHEPLLLHAIFWNGIRISDLKQVLQYTLQSR